ncbi:MAG: hypothetical protein EXR50_08085 [Dehalococcoidia bacterium]|nr:hypothetical protein [Dehalococcoidia bacterium]
MPERPVNSEKLFYNFGGHFPPAALDEKPVEPPKEQSYPKLITDTTLRDGAQDSRFALFPVEARVRYYDLLHRLDNGTGVIDNIESFIYQKRDLWALDKLLQREYEYPRVTTWTRATPKDIKDLVEVSQGRIKETGILASASDHHIFDKLRFHSKEEAVEKYLAPIVTAYQSGIRPRVHLEDCTKADIYGWVIPFMLRVLKETDGVAKFRVCDTMGIGVPDAYAPLPYGIPRLFVTLIEETGAELEFHGHNDFGLATANSMAAFRYGAKKVNTTYGGLGERTGNTSLEQVLANYIRMYGDPGFDLTVLPEMRTLVDEELIKLSSNAPIVGDVFSTQAGIHQSGLHRQEDAEGGLIYLAYDPSTVGRSSLELNIIGALSGTDGIIAVLNSEWEKRYGEKERFSSISRVVKLIYDAIQEAYDGQYNEGTDSISGARTSFYTPEELLGMAESFGEKPRV